MGGMVIGGPIVAAAAAGVAALAKYTTAFDDVGGAIAKLADQLDQVDTIKGKILARELIGDAEAAHEASVKLMELSIRMAAGDKAADDFANAIKYSKEALDAWSHAAAASTNIIGDLVNGTKKFLVLGMGAIDEAAKKNAENFRRAAKEAEDYAKIARALLGSESPGDRQRRMAESDRNAGDATVKAIADLDHRTSWTQIDEYKARVKQLDEWLVSGAINADLYATARRGARGA